MNKFRLFKHRVHFFRVQLFESNPILFSVSRKLRYFSNTTFDMLCGLEFYASQCFQLKSLLEKFYEIGQHFRVQVQLFTRNLSPTFSNPSPTFSPSPTWLQVSPTFSIPSLTLDSDSVGLGTEFKLDRM